MIHTPLQDSVLLEALLGALQATFGKHPGHRATHAKGLIVRGSFTAAKDASRLSRALHLQGQTVPVTLRFSNFSGIPRTADADPTASPRGLGIRFHAGAGADTDIVAHSFDGFPVGAPREFLTFLQGIAASVDAAAPDAAPLERFLAAHPRARTYLDAIMPAPASYDAIPYYGVNAFNLLAADGAPLTGRYRIDPVTPPGQAPAPPRAPDHDYLAEELSRRLRQQPVRMRLVFQLARTGDDTADGSIAWPHVGPRARAERVLGEFRIEALAADQAEATHRLDLDPGRLIDGLALSDDPMVPLRSALYRLAASRRSAPAIFLSNP